MTNTNLRTTNLQVKEVEIEEKVMEIEKSEPEEKVMEIEEQIMKVWKNVGVENIYEILNSPYFYIDKCYKEFVERNLSIVGYSDPRQSDDIKVIIKITKSLKPLFLLITGPYKNSSGGIELSRITEEECNQLSIAGLYEKSSGKIELPGVTEEESNQNLIANPCEKSSGETELSRITEEECNPLLIAGPYRKSSREIELSRITEEECIQLLEDMLTPRFNILAEFDCLVSEVVENVLDGDVSLKYPRGAKVSREIKKARRKVLNKYFELKSDCIDEFLDYPIIAEEESYLKELVYAEIENGQNSDSTCFKIAFEKFLDRLDFDEEVIYALEL